MVLPILIALTVFNKLVYKSWLNPIFLQSVLWLVYYFFLTLNIGVYQVHLQDVQGFLLYQSIGFSVGGFICTLFARRNVIFNRQPFSDSEQDLTYRNLILFYPFVLTVLVVTTFFLVRQTDSFSIFSFAQIKSDLIEDDGKKFGNFGLIQLLTSVYLTTFIATKNAVKENRFKFLILLAVFLFFTLLLGTKGQFVFFFCSVAYIFAWKQKLSKLHLAFAGVCLVGLMLLVTFLRWGAEKDTITGDSMRDLLMTYTITSLPALAMLTERVSPVFGYYTFRVFYVWLNKLGFDFPLSTVLSEFTWTPIPTNVYSYVKPYYFDFGFAGVFWIPFFLAMVHCAFYFQANKGKFLHLIFSSLLIYPLGMQIFEENYLRQFSNWVYVFGLVYMLTQVDFGRRSQLAKLQMA